MIKNYFVIAFRNIKKFRFHSMINFIGISIGIAASLMIFIWVKYELSFDKFHDKIDNLYQVSIFWHIPNGNVESFETNYALAPMLKDNFADITESSSYEKIRMRIKIQTNNEQNSFYEENLIFTTPSLFKMFNFPVISGDYEKSLKEPHFVFLTKHIAMKYFGSIDIIGKSISIGSADYPDANYTIGGILEDCPENSTIRFNIVASYITLDGLFQRRADNWSGQYGWTYINIKKGTDIKDLNKRMSEYYSKLHKPEVTKTLNIYPLKKIHLYTSHGTGNIKSIYVFLLIAFFILSSACFNYINISIAQSIARIKEIGVRKVHGAKKIQLIKQFITESFMLSIISVFLSLILIILSLPFFNELTGIDLNPLKKIEVYFYLIIIAIITSIGTGIYPAFYLSSINVVKSFNYKRSSKSKLRKLLVILQFISSIVLIICSIVVSQQLNYIKNKDLGMNIKDVITFPMSGERQLFDTFKEELLKETDIKAVSSSFSLPNNVELTFNGLVVPGRSDIQEIGINMNLVNYDYIETMEIKMIQGRTFSKSYVTDERSAIMNQKAVEVLNLKEPIGQKFVLWGRYEGTIIGVTNNFHFESLKNNIKPLLLIKGMGFQFDNVIIKISPYNTQNTIKRIEEIWKKYNPDYPFVYSFIEQKSAQMYKSEQKIGEIFSYFTLIAIIISCLGLFGLASLLSVQSAKEVGIRKVLGASVSKITVFMTMGFVRWVVLANIIAIPISYYFMNKWLQTFCYKINISPWVFIIAFFTSISIAIISIIFHTIRAANVNPVKVLSQE